MATLSGVLVISLGIAIGLLLYLSAPDSWKPRPVLYQVVNTIVNVGRSIPHHHDRHSHTRDATGDRYAARPVRRTVSAHGGLHAVARD